MVYTNNNLQNLIANKITNIALCRKKNLGFEDFLNSKPINDILPDLQPIPGPFSVSDVLWSPGFNLVIKGTHLSKESITNDILPFIVPTNLISFSKGIRIAIQPYCKSITAAEYNRFLNNLFKFGKSRGFTFDIDIHRENAGKTIENEVKLFDW